MGAEPTGRLPHLLQHANASVIKEESREAPILAISSLRGRTHYLGNVQAPHGRVSHSSIRGACGRSSGPCIGAQSPYCWLVSCPTSAVRGRGIGGARASYPYSRHCPIADRQ